MTAYSRAGFPEGRTYLVNDKGEVQTTHITYKKSFGELNELLNEVFPPYDGLHIHNNDSYSQYVVFVDAFRRKVKVIDMPKTTPVEDTYGDFNFWRVPIRPL